MLLLFINSYSLFPPILAATVTVPNRMLSGQEKEDRVDGYCPAAHTKTSQGLRAFRYERNRRCGLSHPTTREACQQPVLGSCYQTRTSSRRRDIHNS